MPSTHDLQATVLVLGATGRQGGATARALLHAGTHVRAFTRDRTGEAARALERAGAHLVVGDLDDPASVAAAMNDVDAVFSVQDFHGAGGVDAEERRGRSVADLVARNGYAHLVYSSVGGADRHTGVPHFESKARIEQHIDHLGLQATVLRPTFFIDNFARLGPHPVDGELVLTLALRSDRTLQMVATEDIGRVAALALTDPARFRGRRLELAGDELSGHQIADAFGAATGSPVRYDQQPIDELRASSADSAAMFDWFNRDGYQADLGDVRRQFGPMTTLAKWLRSRENTTVSRA